MTPNFLETVEDEHVKELKVTFYPPLFLQRRIWVLDAIRAERVTRIVDIGCGEGQLLSVLCQPAPWLAPPPSDIMAVNSGTSPPSACDDGILNIHASHIMGLDIDPYDLGFAVQGTTPPLLTDAETIDQHMSHFSTVGLRWEDLEVKIWKGSLETINEEFVNAECIVSMEVIEHLPPELFPAFTPVILGVYHPQIFLVTTPSYTFNARFTAPKAPSSARSGYSDPTKRTSRIFRHADHKFEWTADEFKEWCNAAALEWGYDVQTSSVGWATEVDEWGRDKELGGATSVAIFRRHEMENREARGRKLLQVLGFGFGSHELLVTHQHLSHTCSRRPKSSAEIGNIIKMKMEDLREGCMNVRDLWFEREVSISCGGWIERLIQAAQDSKDLLLKREGEETESKQKDWVVELAGGVSTPRLFWPTEDNTGADYVPSDWIPGEAETDCSESSWGGSTDMEGDISWNDSDSDKEVEQSKLTGWGHGWGSVGNIEIKKEFKGWSEAHWSRDSPDMPHTSGHSTAGWDGDESGHTTN